MPAVEFADATSLTRRPWLEGFHGTGPSCCLFRRAAFERVGGYRTFLRLAYDWDLYMRFLKAGGGVIFVPKILCIYRLHDEQMVQKSSVDGLWDMLAIWQEPDYAHWPARTLAGLALAQCGIKWRYREGVGGIVRMFTEIHRRKLLWRLLGGMPGAFWDKLMVRLGYGNDDGAKHYVSPVDAETTVALANKTLNSAAAP